MGNKIKSHGLAATLLAVVVGMFATQVEARRSPVGDPAVVIEWNQLAQRYIGGSPFGQTRAFAMVHVAIADSAVAIEGQYDPFYFKAFAPRGASTEAAVAQAAHDVLVVVAPTGLAAYDTALAARLAPIPAGLRKLGVDTGKKVASAVLAWRANDGFATANPQPPPFLPSTLPGIWRQAASGPTIFSKLGEMQPFGLLTSTQFLPVPQPQLESAAYAKDFNEVKQEGERPANFPGGPFNDHQRTALLWAGGAGTP